MPPSSPITLPAGYAPAFAVGFSDSAGSLALVADTAPLPVTLTSGTIQVQAVESAPPPPPLTGSASTSGIVGPFSPVALRAVMLALTGIWEGTARLTRSTDNGATKLPLTAGGLPWGSYSANVCEPAWFESEGGVELYLDVALTSGTLSYRIAQ